MNIPEVYGYLVLARRDLWAVLEAAPDEVLSRPVLTGKRFHCVKDLVLHVPMIEDSWVHEDVLRDRPVWSDFPALEEAGDGPNFAGFALADLLSYWRAVQDSTLAFLGTLTDAELGRVVSVAEAPEYRYTVREVLWHVLIHEMRHTAQISTLLRSQGVEPPDAVLLRYLPALRGELKA